MKNEQKSHLPEPETSADDVAFNRWLQAQLKARKLTQRQLAQKAGVDHSTISRLIRGERVPSLRTATRLARSLGSARSLVSQDEQRPDQSPRPAAGVEYALRADNVLGDADVREIMNVYRAAWLRRFRTDHVEHELETTSSAPMPIVIEVGRSYSK